MKIKTKVAYLVCKWVGHRHKYSKNGSQKLRACLRCGCIDEYRMNVPMYESGWFTLCQYTKRGADLLLFELKEVEK